MHTLNLKKFYPFTYLELRSRNAPCFHKNLKNILFDCGTAYFTYLKSPFTYLEFERQNATCFLEKTENFFEKAVYLKNIPSLVPTGNSQMHTQNLKKFFVPSLIWN